MLAAGRDVRAALAATEERAAAFRAQYLGFAHLWTTDMQGYLKVWCDAKRFLHTRHPVAKADVHAALHCRASLPPRARAGAMASLMTRRWQSLRRRS